MANIKISEMTEATIFDDGDYTMIVQANQNKKISKENMLSEVGELSNLETINKSNIVNSINEVNNIATNNAKDNIYSLSETDTGKIWIDGNPIYRKVIDCGALPNNSIKTVAHNISNIDFFVEPPRGISYSSSTGNYFPLPYAADSVNAQVKIWATNTDINLQTITDRSGYAKTYVILEYTKATD